MRKIEKIEQFALSGTDDGKIEIALIQEPYGSGSEIVASIGIFLNRDNSEPDWKVHIPKANIDAVIEALQKAKNML